jgi:hypothetical protein
MNIAVVVLKFVITVCTTIHEVIARVVQHIKAHRTQHVEDLLKKGQPSVSSVQLDLVNDLVINIYSGLR